MVTALTSVESSLGIAMIPPTTTTLASIAASRLKLKSSIFGHSILTESAQTVR